MNRSPIRIEDYIASLSEVEQHEVALAEAVIDLARLRRSVLDEMTREAYEMGLCDLPDPDESEGRAQDDDH